MKRHVPCIPLGSRVSGNRFPPKTAPGPPDDGSHADSRSFIHAREFPRFRDSRAWTAYAEERIAPLFPVTIPCRDAARKRKKPSGRRKNNAGGPFFKGGQVCWSSFASGTVAVAFDGTAAVDHRGGSENTPAAGGLRTPDCSEAGKTRRQKTAPGTIARMRQDNMFLNGAPIPGQGEDTEADISSAHFGMRNSGTGICMP